MKDYIKLLMGLVSGFALILLNTNMVSGAIGNISTFFDPTKTNTIFFNLGSWMSRICVILSFIGIWIVIIYAILILKKVIFTKDN